MRLEHDPHATAGDLAKDLVVAEARRRAGSKRGIAILRCTDLVRRHRLAQGTIGCHRTPVPCRAFSASPPTARGLAGPYSARCRLGLSVDRQVPWLDPDWGGLPSSAMIRARGWMEFPEMYGRGLPESNHRIEEDSKARSSANVLVQRAKRCGERAVEDRCRNETRPRRALPSRPFPAGGPAMRSTFTFFLAGFSRRFSSRRAGP